MLVTFDGRSLVDLGLDQLGILDADGAVLTVFDPASMFDGRMDLQVYGGSVSGNDAFVVYTREGVVPVPEIVVLRIDESNAVRIVRRVPVEGFGNYPGPFALPDGTVFVIETEGGPAGPQHIRRFGPDGTDAVVWREEETAFEMHMNSNLLIGPLHP